MLGRIERYYDTVPRATATTHEVGPFTLFVATRGWQFYARPRFGHVGPVTADDVRRVLEVQRDRGVPQQIEWVHEVTPGLLPVAREAGVRVAECPLMVLGQSISVPANDWVTRMLDPDDPRFALARAAVAAGFAGTDDPQPEPVPEHIAARVRGGLMCVAGAFDADGAAIGGGSHALRGDVSELMGIAVLPHYRRRGVGATLTKVLAEDALALGATTVFLSAGTLGVARVYERVGFHRVGTACIAEAR